ncbi:MAG TPA: hypothetical protein VF219_08375 [Vicinamibacterales bacterium]
MNSRANLKQTITRLLTSLAILASVLVATKAQATEPEGLTAPPVPAVIQVPPGVEPFLVGHGVGTQNYVCVERTPGRHE